MTDEPVTAALIDRVTQPGETELVRRDGYWVARTPSFPGYHCGNCLALDGPPTPDSLPGWMEVWERELGQAPGLGCVKLLWDEPGPDPGPDRSFPEPFRLDGTGVLALVEPRPAAAPAAVDLRVLAGPPDWAAATVLVRDRVYDGLVDGGQFTTWRLATHQANVERGLAQWWGAWQGERLVATAGLYSRPDWARFQEVVVDRDYRRRGIATTLVAAMAAAHRARAPGVPCYIVAGLGSEPERIYRRIGFERIGRQYELTAPVPPA